MCESLQLLLFFQCSYGLCKPVLEDNFKEIEKFKDSLVVGKQYDFLYNPANVRQVINNRYHQLGEIFHCLFWPLVILVVPAILLAFFMHLRHFMAKMESPGYGLV